MSLRRIRGPAVPAPLELEAPSSKSVTHRALVAAALAGGTTRIRRPLDAVDTVTTAEGLSALGAPVRRAPGCWTVASFAGRPAGGATLALRESGTSARFLTAVAALGRRPSRLDGAPRLRERPLAPLAGALRALGARVGSDALPLDAGGGTPGGGRVQVAAGQSSQFASALLLIARALPEGLDLELHGPVVSAPYLDVTVRVLEAFGVRVERVDERRVRVAPGSGPVRASASGPEDYEVEGDWSTASYPFCAAAILGARVRVRRLRADSAQGDRRFLELLRRVGCRVEQEPDAVTVEGTGRLDAFDVDLTDTPDLAPTAAVLAAFATGDSTLRGVAHLRLKESDRLELLARNLRTLGRPARVAQDRLEIGGAPSRDRAPVDVETGADHRMAMAFAVAGLRREGLAIDDAACVAKSHPGFWDQLRALGGTWDDEPGTGSPGA